MEKSKFMRGYESTWLDKPTFKLMCVSNDCPFVEGIYLPEEKLLIVVSKFKQHKFEYLPKLDDDGNPQYAKTDPRVNKEKLFKRQRVQYDGNYDYTLSNIEDIKSFVKEYAQDNANFDFDKYLK